MNIYVVIVTYNPKKWIDQCFLSLRSSTVAVKTIVIDNGSTDGSQDVIIKHYPEVEFIQSSINLGFGKANNIGIKKAYDAGTDFVFLLNQDAWIEPDTIDKLVVAAKKNPEFGLISPIHLNGKGTDLDFNFSKYLSPNDSPSFISDAFLGKVHNNLYKIKFVNAAAWLLTRKCIETVGGFNPLFDMYGEDNNYLQRIFYHDFHIGVLANVRIYHDRDVREKSNYLIDESKIFRRNLLIKYCNPANKHSIIEEISWRKKIMIRELLKCHLSNYKKLREEIKMINPITSEVESTKNVSKRKGLSFL